MPRQHPSESTNQSGKRPADGITPPFSPPLHRPGAGVRGWLLALLALGVSLTAGYFVGQFVWRQLHPPAPSGGPAGEAVVVQFVEWKNAGDPRAADLLGPARRFPEEPVPEMEAQRLQADFLLREPFRIEEFQPRHYTSGRWRTLPEGQYALTVKGNLAGRLIRVKTASGTKEIQPALYNPILIVEVRDGKIHGVRPALWEGP